jgi:hypothetical protein
MDTRRTPIAAASSMLVNLALALSLAQAAGAATPAAYRATMEPATDRVAEAPQAGQAHAHTHCAARLRLHVETRTLVAVILGMIV